MLPLIIEVGKLAHSEVSQSSWGNDLFSSQVKSSLFHTVESVEHMFIGKSDWDFHFNLGSIVAKKGGD